MISDAGNAFSQFHRFNGCHVNKGGIRNTSNASGDVHALQFFQFMECSHRQTFNSIADNQTEDFITKGIPCPHGGSVHIAATVDMERTIAVQIPVGGLSTFARGSHSASVHVIFRVHISQHTTNTAAGSGTAGAGAGSVSQNQLQFGCPSHTDGVLGFQFHQFRLQLIGTRRNIDNQRAVVVGDT